MVTGAFRIGEFYKDIRKITMKETAHEMNAFFDHLRARGLDIPDVGFDFDQLVRTSEHNKKVYSELIMRNKYRQHLNCTGNYINPRQAENLSYRTIPLSLIAGLDSEIRIRTLLFQSAAHFLYAESGPELPVHTGVPDKI